MLGDSFHGKVCTKKNLLWLWLDLLTRNSKDQKVRSPRLFIDDQTCNSWISLYISATASYREETIIGKLFR